MSKTRRWIRRLLAICLGIVLGLGLLTWWGYERTNAVPQWYSEKVMTPEEMQVASGRAMQKIAGVMSWAGERRAAQIRQTNGSKDTMHVTFSEDEINAVLLRWMELSGWRDRIERHAQSPQVRFDGKRLIVGARVTQLNRIVGAHFQPDVKDGRLDMRLQQLTAGSQWVPLVFLGSYIDKAEKGLRAKLPGLQKKAALGPQGDANIEALTVSFSLMVLDILDEKSSDPRVFIQAGPDSRQRIAVQVLEIYVEGGELHVVARALKPDEQQQMLDDLKKPL